MRRSASAFASAAAASAAAAAPSLPVLGDVGFA